MEPRPRIDRDSRREAILDVAEAVFTEDGFQAASMSLIAARLGGSKGTLYNYFKSKEELFAAHVDRQCARQQELMGEMIAQASDVRAALFKLGRTLLSLVATGVSLRNFVVVAAESCRAPQIGQAFYESGPVRGHRLVVQCIEQAVARGELRACDASLAAHQFVAMCQNRLFKARLCNYAPEPTDAEMDAEVSAAVVTFMAAFGPGPAAEPCAADD